MDFSKAFDTLNHELLIAKLGAYEFKTEALRYMKSYLTNIKQRVKVNKKFKWERITTGVLEGSIFNIKDLYYLTFFQTIFFFSFQTLP